MIAGALSKDEALRRAEEELIDAEPYEAVYIQVFRAKDDDPA